MGAHFLDAFLGAIFGGIVTIAVAIWIEHLRSPLVRLGFDAPEPIPARGPFQNDWRSLRVRVSNKPLSDRLWANKWMSRLPAQQCRAEICFLRTDGTLVFDKPMTGRWPGTPEPRVIRVQVQGGGTVTLLDNPYELKPTVDIYPGESEGLDIVVRVEGETSCYGWNDETYYYENWRNPKWELEHRLYLV